MPEYIIEIPSTGCETIDITARNDRAAKKKTRSMLASNGVLEYKWHKDATYRVLCLYRHMPDNEEECTGTTHEHICDIEELVGSGNLVEAAA